MSSILFYVFGALGGLLFGYDTGVISGAVLFIDDELGLTPFTKGVVVSGILVGAMIGAGTCGRLADRLGRRKVILGAGVIFALGSLGCAAATSIPMLAGFRIFLGLAVGTASVAVPLYLSELAPTAIRGRLSSLNQLAITVGILSAYVVDYALAEAGAWRWMLGLGTVPAVILIAGMLRLPDTPRWLVREGRVDDARSVLARVRPDPSTIDDEIAEIRRVETYEAGHRTHGARALLSSWVRPILLLGLGLAVFQQFVGINTVIYYAPTTLTTIGFGSAAATLANVGIGVVNVGFTFVAIHLLDKVGRRALLLAGSTVMAVSLALVTLVAAVGGRGPLTGYVTIVCLATYIAGFAASWGPTVWVMLPEIFPLSVRGSGVGVSTVGNWTANFVVALTFPVLLAAMGTAASFGLFLVLTLVAIGFVLAYVPETKGRSLEQIETDLRAHGVSAGRR